MSSRNAQIVLFDYLGTVVDAGPRYAEAFIRACRVHGFTAPEPQSVIALLGEKNLKQIISDLLPEMCSDQVCDFMGTCNAERDALLHDPSWNERLYPHVPEALKLLRAEGCRIGMYTGSRENVWGNLSHYGIQKYFDLDLVRNNKASFRMKSGAAKTMQLRDISAAFRCRFNIVAVGDTPSDYKAAQEVGMAFIAFAPRPTSYFRFAAISYAVPVFMDYDQLPSVLGHSLPQTCGCHKY